MISGDRSMMDETVPRTPEQYFDGRPYGRLLVPESAGGFSAEILEFPGCIAEGDTAEEAVNNVEETAKAWIESELEQNHSIPEPICGDEYSGRIALRLPKSLHRALAIKAQRDGTSINSEVVGAVACWLGAEDMLRRLAQTLARRATMYFPSMHTVTVSTSYGHHGSAPAAHIGTDQMLLESAGLRG